MSRFLFVVPPLVGHVNPAAGVARALGARGHVVAWAGSAELVRQLAGRECAVFPCAVTADADRPPELRGPAALRWLWERFLCPLAEAMAPGVQEALDRFAPDVVVADQQALAGALVAERNGVPWATSATTSAELTDPLAALPKVEAWLRELMADLRERLGDPHSDRDLRFSADLVLAYTSEALVQPAPRLRDRIRFVGPVLTDRPVPTAEFPWHRLHGAGPVVLVTLGTANADAGARFLRECARGCSCRTVIVDPAGTLGAVAEHVLVRRAVPQLPLLARVDAVVCHAGHNTVCEALAHGLPLVLAPIRDDQPIVAQQVVDAGAGIRLRFNRATADQIGAAIHAVLEQPEYRRAARRVQQSFRAAGGARAAADHLEQLASRVSSPVGAERST